MFLVDRATRGLPHSHTLQTSLQLAAPALDDPLHATPAFGPAVHAQLPFLHDTFTEQRAPAAGGAAAAGARDSARAPRMNGAATSVR